MEPGFFHLPLPVNAEASNPPTDAIKRKMVDIEHDLQSRADRPEELAIHNLIGLFQCRLQQYDKALDHFGIVLSKDKENLNAMANKQFVLKKLFRVAEAKSFKSKLDRFLSQPTEDGAITESHVRARARCLAEQAYVYACDLHTDKASASRERFITSNKILQEALGLAGDLVETSEKDAWKFWMASNAHKIFNNLCYDYKYHQAVDHMDEAVKLFWEITRRDPGDREYVWESWRNLADIFRNIQRRKECRPPRHFPREMQRFMDDPEECMKKAMEIAPDNPKLLARYANFLYSCGREVEEPLRLLNKSISLDSSEYNFYAFSTRATVLWKGYKVKTRKVKEDSSRNSPPDRSMLETARDDLEKAIEFRDAAWNLLFIAEVHHLLAESSAEVSEGRLNLNKELGYLRRAYDCEQGDRRERVLRSLGRFFFDVGDYREAISKFKEAENMHSGKSDFAGIFRELFRTYLTLMQSDHRHAENKSILEEIAQSLSNALFKYGSSCLVRHCIAPSRAKFQHELQLLIDYCETIPDSDLLDALRSQEPASTKAPPVFPGGTLGKFWNSPTDSEPVQDTGAATAESLSESSPDVNPTRGEELDKAQGAAASLVSGFSSMSITEPSVRASAKPGYSYDFNVVYMEKDCEWVHRELLPAMENRGLRGCTNYRDADAGSYIAESKLFLINQSAGIILVHNRHFSRECAIPMNHALKLKESGRVIVSVLRDGSTVPGEMQFLSSFDATVEPVDWDVLADTLQEMITDTGLL